MNNRTPWSSSTGKLNHDSRSDREENELKCALAGRYELIRKLGSGNMATVYHARELSLDRDVAIKVLPQSFLHDEQLSIRFKREAKIVAKLEHPGIVRIF